MTEAVVETKDPRQRSDVVLVTGENFNAHVDKMLGKTEAEPVKVDESDPAAVAAAELKVLDDAKADKAKADAAEAEEIDHPDETKRGRLTERFSDLTSKRKAAESAAKTANDARIAAEQRAEQAAADAAALRAKYEPPKSDVLGPEPKPEQFTDTAEFAKALKEWTADATRQEDAEKSRAEAQKTEREGAAKAFKEREEIVRKEVKDYDKRLSDSQVNLSDQMADEIRASDVGPQILLHFADHPEDALAMGKLNIGGMLKAFGRLEATLQKGAPVKATVIDIKDAAKAQVSKAPAPISPLGGGGAPVTRLSGSDEVPKEMTYDQWKKMRESGKIA